MSESTQTNVPDPNPAPNAAPTQQEVNAQLAGVPAEAVTAAMTAAAPATQAEHLDNLSTRLAQLEGRVQQVEGVVGAAAPVAQGFAELIPGVGPEVAAGIGLLPQLITGFNNLLAEVQAAFGGKVAATVQPVTPPNAS